MRIAYIPRAIFLYIILEYLLDVGYRVLIAKARPQKYRRLDRNLERLTYDSYHPFNVVWIPLLDLFRCKGS